MKHFKGQAELIRLQEFRIFFDEDVMFLVCGKSYHYLRMIAISDREAIISARTMFPRLTVRCVLKLDIWDWIEIA